MNWLISPLEGEMHITPVGDLREHIQARSCWCHPKEPDDDGIVIHNSMDRREEFERGERPAS